MASNAFKDIVCDFKTFVKTLCCGSRSSDHPPRLAEGRDFHLFFAMSSRISRFIYSAFFGTLSSRSNMSASVLRIMEIVIFFLFSAIHSRFFWLSGIDNTPFCGNMCTRGRLTCEVLVVLPFKFKVCRKRRRPLCGGGYFFLVQFRTPKTTETMSDRLSILQTHKIFKFAPKRVFFCKHNVATVA